MAATEESRTGVMVNRVKVDSAVSDVSEESRFLFTKVEVTVTVR